ncbi:MAG: hypothetical protein OXL97_05925 [Chloroflexota bacterium]|nr:hypothetical protein [Chloroflexota bacterium]MDE2885141.1 hypothetical protein [Chloroflexota bacterium]
MKPRKLILSRKGFDSKAGGCPSPIFTRDGTMVSLPIPVRQGQTRYRDLHHNGENMGDLVRDLSDGAYGRLAYANLNPDVNRAVRRERDERWRGLSGQLTPSASGHLLNQAVGIGDVFLFFGLFQWVEKARGKRGKYRFISDEPAFHVLWGWLQVGGAHVRDDLGDDDFPWAQGHPHMHEAPNPYNLLYFASRDLDLGRGRIADGCGVFGYYDDRLRLTRSGGTATQWRLPRWFHPGDNRTPLSNMGNNKWSLCDDGVYVQRTGYGQEFVLDLDEYPEGRRWVASLCRRFGSEQPA